jgi:hypothetical protein
MRNVSTTMGGDARHYTLTPVSKRCVQPKNAEAAIWLFVFLKRRSLHKEERVVKGIIMP